MNFAAFGTVAAFALTVLVNGLWQGALLAGAAWFVLRTARTANATTRHAVLVAALLGALVLPIVTTTIAFTHPHASPLVQTSTSAGQWQHAPQANPGRHARVPAQPVSQPALRHTEPVAVRPLATQLYLPPQSVGPLVTLPRIAILILVGLWFVGALLLIARLAFSLLYLERLKGDALPLPVEYRSRLERWAAIGKGARDVRLCRSSEVAVPIAVGIFDAMILVPERLLDELPAEDVDRILLHELAHLRRGDDWINALERVAEALLFFNPGVRWMVRQLDVEREVACDDWVLERRSEALPYAQCLVKLVEGVAWPYRPMTAPGVFVTRRSISIRIERLLSKQRDVRLRVSPGPLAAVGGLAVAACVLGAYLSPSFAATATAGSTSGRHPSTALSLWKPTAKPTQHGTPKPFVVANAQPTSVPTSEPTPVPAPIPSASAVARPLVAAAAVHASVEARTHAAVRAAMSTSTMTRHGSTTAASDVRSQVAALSDASDATPAPAMTGEDFIAEMATAGYTNLSVDDLIRLKSIGVTGAYVREVQAAGLGHPPIHELEQMRAVGVAPQFVAEMHRQFPGVTLADVISLRAVGVTTSYASELRAAGVKDLNPDTLRSMRAVGVDPAYVRELSAAGYANLNASQLTQLRAVGIDNDFLRKVKEHGLHNLSLDDLVKLKTSGVLIQ